MSHTDEQVASYYAASARDKQPYPALEGEVRADVCVVGGGLTGVNTALELAQRGLSVVLLEARCIGWGASGRNGGQLIRGIGHDVSGFAKYVGEEGVRYLERAGTESVALVAQRIRNSLISNKKTRLTANAGEAEAVLKISQEERTKVILSLSGAGRVTEYRLGLRLTYTVDDKAGKRLAAPEVLELTRDITYDDTKVLAKGAEEQLLYRDMDDNAAQRIVRRLQAIKPGPAADEHPG